MNRLALFLMMAVLAIACTPQRDPCLQPRTPVLHGGIYKLGDTTLRDTSLPALMLVPLDADTNVVLIGGNSSKFSLFLSPLQDSCRYLIVPDTALPLFHDTLVFYYTRERHFLSNACGYTYFYDLTAVRTTNFLLDSFYLNKTGVNNNTNEEHLRIFY